MRLFKSTEWSLHNPLKDWTLQGLGLEEVQLIVSTLTTAEQQVVLVWNKRWIEWHPLNSENCDILFAEIPRRGPKPPPIAACLLSEKFQEITQVRPVLNRRAPTDRKHARYVATVECEVIVGEHCFVTISRDISLGGICFAQALPEWVAGYFTVILKAPERPMEFMCMMVEDQKQEKFRAEIINNRPEVLDEFQSWLEASQFPLLKNK